MATAGGVKPLDAILLSALETRPLPDSLPFRTGVYRFPSGSSNTTCVVVFDVPVENMKAAAGSAAETSRFHASFIVIVRTAHGQIVKSITADADYEWKNLTPDRLRTATLSVSRPFELEPGSYVIETVLSIGKA
jgi:hypothetical protein